MKFYILYIRISWIFTVSTITSKYLVFNAFTRYLTSLPHFKYCKISYSFLVRAKKLFLYQCPLELFFVLEKLTQICLIITCLTIIYNIKLNDFNITFNLIRTNYIMKCFRILRKYT